MRNKWVPLFVLAGMLLFSAAVYNQLPDNVPSHWNLQGEVDGYLPKWQGVLLLPAITAVIWIARYAARRVDPRRQSYQEFEGTYYLFINAITTFLALIHIMSLGTALGWQISINQLVLPGVGLLYLLMGNEMRRIQPNWFIGIRTPWTLSDPDVWRETHTVGGRAMFGVGMVTLLTGLLLPGGVAVSVMIVSLLAMVAWVYYYSYRRYQLRHAH